MAGKNKKKGRKGKRSSGDGATGPEASAGGAPPRPPLKVHHGLIWLRVAPEVGEQLQADEKISPLLALSLDAHTFAVEPDRYAELRKWLVKRGWPPLERGSA
jgi:hypothetical protein